MEIRKISLVKETVFAEAERQIERPINRVAALVCFPNPFAGKGYVEDLSSLFDYGRAAGLRVSDDLVALLDGDPCSYGKAAIVGIAGQVEHGAACIHPKLGKPMREAVGGGKAIIPSNCKVGAVGSAIDVPLGDKDEVWIFPSFDTMTVAMPDGPRPDEIVVVVAMADGGRVMPRVGSGPITD
ncbi:MAG: amino acid synthesis family protein [Pseudomonadota bacterium]